MREPNVPALASAVADGETVDWERVSARLTTPQARAVVAQLKTLSQINAASSTSPTSETLPNTHLPVLLQVVLWLAALICAVALVGTLLGGELSPKIGLQQLIMVTFGLMGLLLSGATHDARAVALAGVFFTIGAAFAPYGLLRAAATMDSGTMTAVLTAIRPEAFLPAFLWQFARVFPRTIHFSRIDRLCDVICPIALVLGIALFASNLVPALLPDSRPWLQTLDRMRGTGAIFWLFVFGTMIPALFIMPLRARDSSASEQRRVRILLSGLVAGLVPITIAVMFEGTWPAFARYVQTPTGRALSAAIILLPILAMPMVMAYGLAVHGVLRLRVIVRNRLRYLLAGWVLLGGTILASVVLLLYLYVQRHRPVAEVLSTVRAQLLCAAVIAGASGLMLRAWLMRALDRWARVRSDDPAALLAMLAVRLDESRTPQELASAFAAVAAKALNTTAAVYLILDGKRLVPVGETADVPENSLIPVLLAGSNEPVIVESGHTASFYALLNDNDRKWIDRRDIAAVVPLTPGRGESRAFAMVALHARPDRLALSRDDMRFLVAAAASVTFALQAWHAEVKVEVSPETDELAVQCARCGRVDVPGTGRTCVCGGNWETASLPRLLGNRFEVVSLLGAGGMGRVYRGLDRVLHRQVAIKTLPTLKREAAERLLAEARAMAALSHSHIATLYGTETWHATPILLMEYLTAGTLAARLRQGPVPRAQAFQLVLSLARALEYMHEAGRCHGDIKPSNIGLTTNDTPKFLDFGLSRVWDGQDGPLSGTLPYLSPEALGGAPPDDRQDLWALTVVLYEALTGVHPFLDAQRTSDRILKGFVAGPVAGPVTSQVAGRVAGQTSTESPGVTLGPNLSAFFHDALSADSARRPRNATGLVRLVSQLSEG